MSTRELGPGEAASIISTYDPEAACVYIYLKSEPVVISVESGDCVVDLNASYEVIGIEVLHLPLHLPQLSHLAEKFDFTDKLADVWAALLLAQPCKQLL